MRLKLPTAKAIVADLIAGSLSSLLVIAYGISFGALIFSFDQGLFLSQGMSVTLISCVVVGLIAALGSSLPIIIAGPDSLVTALLAVSVASIAADVHTAGGQAENVLATVLFSLTASAVLAGIIYWLLGRTHKGLLMQYLPYPVVGGFLAGSGYMIVRGAFRLLSSKELNLENLLHTPENFPLATAIATVVCLALLIIPRWWKHYLLLPLTIFLGIALAYLCLYFLHIDIETARQAHVIFQPLHVEAALPLTQIPLANVYWPVVLANIPEILIAMAVGLLTILMNTTGIEVMIKRDLDHNQELKIAGISNILTGLAGGIFGYQFFNRTNINHMAGATGRLSGIWASLITLGTLLVFPGVVGYFPLPVLAGLLAFVGIALLNVWVIKTMRQLNNYEYGLILIILAVIAVKGFMIGVLVGVAGACVLFAFHYSKINAIKYDFIGCQNFSKCVRSQAKMDSLKQQADKVYGICLRGFIFFGSANEILLRCRQQINLGAEFIVIDLRLVQALEASGGQTLLRLLDLCLERKAQLIFTGLQQNIHRQLQRQGFKFNKMLEFNTLAEGMKYVEEHLLHQQDLQEQEKTLEQQLAPYFQGDNLAHLISYLEKTEIKQGSVIFSRGEPGDHLFFIAQGQISILTSLEQEKAIRLAGYSEGTVIGEMAVFTKTPRNAYVVANTDCLLYKLTQTDIAHMGKVNSETLIQLQNYLLVTLASRLTSTNQSLEILV